MRAPGTHVWLILAFILTLTVTGVGVFSRSLTLSQLSISVFGGLLGTAFGVTVGLYSDRQAQAAWDRKAKATRIEADEKALALLELLLRDELQHNGTAVLQIRDALRASKQSRQDVWDLAVEAADSIEDRLFAEFNRMRRARLNAGLFENVSLTYRSLIRLKHQVRQGRAYHALVLGTSANQASADQRKNDVAIGVDIVRGHIEGALASLRTQLTLNNDD